MSWALIRSSDGALVGGPFEKKPTPPAGQYVVVVAFGYPDTMTWSATRRGFTTLQSKAELLADIDARAGTARTRYLTAVPGQADAYREKMVDVASLNGLAGTLNGILLALKGYTDAQQKAKWPFLYAEMKARGLATLVDARDAIVAAADASRQARAEIERIRRTGKIAVNAATTLAAANTAAAAVTFPS